MKVNDWEMPASTLKSDSGFRASLEWFAAESAPARGQKRSILFSVRGITSGCSIDSAVPHERVLAGESLDLGLAGGVGNRL